jgi:hypothetical protein
MFGWLTTRCPVDTWEKAWTERRMRWLADHLGPDRLLQAEVILPTDAYFPDPYGGTAADARHILERLGGFMRVNPRGLDLQVRPDIELPGAAGHYVPGPVTVIRIAESQLQHPMSLVATLAHELAHVILLGGGLLDPTIPDHEWVTDLLPVFLGVGIFSANATVQESHEDLGVRYWWRIGRQGYLPSRVLGYGLALFAFLRGEDQPEWAAHLRLDAAAALHGGLRYLHKTGDTLCHPDSLRRPLSPASLSELMSRLHEGTPSARLGALWDLQERGPAAAEAVPAVTRCLQDHDPHLAGEAARTLAAIGPAAAPALPQLLEVLHQGVPSTRAAAAQALGTLGLQPERVAPELCPLLGAAEHGVVYEAACALRDLGQPVPRADRLLLKALTAALVACDFSLADALNDTLYVMVPRAEERIRKHFRHDPDLRRQALGLMHSRRDRRAGSHVRDSAPGQVSQRRTF